jgi:acyl-CoA thioester hydrolase
MAIKFRRPAKLDEALVVVSRLIRIRAAAVHIHQRVMRGPELLAEADVTAALVAPDGRPKRQPARWASAYAGLIWTPEEQGD